MYPPDKIFELLGDWLMRLLYLLLGWVLHILVPAECLPVHRTSSMKIALVVSYMYDQSIQKSVLRL